MKTVFTLAVCLVGCFGACVSHGADVPVTNTNDDLGGSLRQSIKNAKRGDRIVFQIPTSDGGYYPDPQTFFVTLTSGELVIDKDLTIDAGGQKIVVRRSTVSGDTPYFRVFHITAGTVVLSGLTIQYGNASTSADPTGGGIHNSGNLTLRHCGILDNTGGNSGGGLNNAAGSALIDSCTFGGNNAKNGGGIINFAALTVTNSTFYGNKSTAGNGGAINNSGTSLSVSSCTISGNTSSGMGGGIATGGLAPHVADSIIAGNTTTGSATSVDVFGPCSSDGYNFIGVVNDQTSGFGNPGSNDQTGTNAKPADPRLGPLQDNGGPAETMKPGTGSPVIDQGNSNGTTVDERNAPRPVFLVGGSKPGDGSDIGAFEKGKDQWPESGNTLTVTNLAEHGDSECTVDDCTLREAIQIGNFLVANAGTGPMSINFAPGLSGVILNTKVATGLQVSQALTINGPGARVLTVSGEQFARIFDITAGAVVTIDGLTISYGNSVSVGSGGAIQNAGTLTLQECSVLNNSGGSGGGAANSGTLTVDRCTFAGNQSTGHGGALRNTSTLTVTNSTFYNNTSVNSGAISSFINSGGPATVTVTNCTVTENNATDNNATGGGLNNGANSTFTVRNTLVAYNLTRSPSGDDLAGAFTSGGHNLIRSDSGSTGFTDGKNGDLVGTSYNYTRGPFVNNGGPTDTTALLSGSSAIDKGDDANAPATDQRGYYRSGTSDIGAFEFTGVAPTPTPTATPTATATPAPTGTPEASATPTATPLPNVTPTPTATATTTPEPSATPTPSTTPGSASQLLNLSTRKQVGTGDNVLIGGFIVVGSDDKQVIVRGLGPSLPVSDALADPTLELHDAATTLLAFDDNWKDKQQAEIEATGIPPTNDVEAAIVGSLAARPVEEGGAGYTGVLAGQGGTTGIGLLEIYDLNTSANSTLANISTRGFVGTGDDLLIGGFIPGPSDRAALKVLVRALGPSLTAQGVNGALEDPVLELHDANGTLLTNDNWKDADNASEIQATLPPPDDRESAIITILAPSNAGYTAVVRGVGNTTGVALVEVYALP